MTVSGFVAVENVVNHLGPTCKELSWKPHGTDGSKKGLPFWLLEASGHKTKPAPKSNLFADWRTMRAGSGISSMTISER